VRYELAKKLKDAGFPQADPNRALNVGTFQYVGDNSDKETLCYIPTLSELIEACGHYFYQLTKEDDGSWTCASINGYPKSGFGVTNSPTLEEAVAKLWLALNKK
jgi:hypothetical protein